MSEDLKISYLLTGGQDDRTTEEFVGPLVQQGGSPKLLRSVNTRHGIQAGTCKRSPPFTAFGPGAAGRECYGLIPSECGENVVSVYRPGVARSHVYADAGRMSSRDGALASFADSTKPQSAYLPMGIAASMAVPGGSSVSPIATCYSATLGLVFFAYVTPSLDTTVSLNDLMLVAKTTSGTQVGQPVRVGAISGRLWCALTVHGADGVRLWHMATASAQVLVRTVSVSGNVVSASATTAIVTPVSDLQIDVTSDGAGFAYLLAGHAANASDVTLSKVNIATNAIAASVTYAGAAPGYACCSVAWASLSGVPRVAVAISDDIASATLVSVHDTAGAMVATRAAATFLHYGLVAVRFLHTTLDANLLSVAISPHQNSFAGGTGGNYTYVHALQVNAAVTVASTYLPWMVLQNRGAQLVYSSGEQYPLFFLACQYGVDAYLGTLDPDDQVLDPSVVAYLHGRADTVSPTARFGSLRFTQAPAFTNGASYLGSGCAVQTADGVLVTYRKALVTTNATGNIDVACPGRAVVLDTTPGQPRTAFDKDGLTLVAGALPVQYDGVEFVEQCGPLYQPHITAVAQVSTGEDVPAGVYSVRVQFQWQDAAGLLHYSVPSPIAVVTVAANEEILVKVTAPTGTLRAGVSQWRMDAVVYATEANGASLHRRPEQMTSAPADSYHSVLLNGATNGANGGPYSGGAIGEEQLGQPPCPLFDVAIVGARAMGIDAEVRSRGVFSKLRVAGRGFEWSPNYEINFPSGAGKLMAVREWQGLSVWLTERAVFQVSDSGPSNQIGDAGSYAPPVKIADIGCSNENSVISTPVGVLWQDGDRILMFNGAAVAPLPEVRVPTPITGAALLRNQREVCFFTADGDDVVVRVLNYDTPGRWSQWDEQTMPEDVRNVVPVPYDSDAVVVYGQDTGNLYRLDAALVSDAESMVWETDWIVYGGDWQDGLLLRRVFFNGTIVGPHGLTIEVYLDYEETPSTVRDWDAETLDGLAIGGRYSVWFEPAEQSARAVKFRVYDTVEDSDGGVGPRTLTLLFAVDEAIREAAFAQGAMK